MRFVLITPGVYGNAPTFDNIQEARDALTKLNDGVSYIQFRGDFDSNEYPADSHQKQYIRQVALRQPEARRPWLEDALGHSAGKGITHP